MSVLNRIACLQDRKDEVPNQELNTVDKKAKSEVMKLL